MHGAPGAAPESDHHGSRFYFTAEFIGLLKILDLPCSGCENLSTFSWVRYCTVELTQPFSLLFSWTSYCQFLNNSAHWAVRVDGQLAGTGCWVRRPAGHWGIGRGTSQPHGRRSGLITEWNGSKVCTDLCFPFKNINMPKISNIVYECW